MFTDMSAFPCKRPWQSANSQSKGKVFSATPYTSLQPVSHCNCHKPPITFHQLGKLPEQQVVARGITDQPVFLWPYLTPQHHIFKMEDEFKGHMAKPELCEHISKSANKHFCVLDPFMQTHPMLDNFSVSHWKLGR